MFWLRGMNIFWPQKIILATGKYILGRFEIVSDVLEADSGARSVSGVVGDDTATNPGKGRKVGFGRKDNHQWGENTEKVD